MASCTLDSPLPQLAPPQVSPIKRDNSPTIYNEGNMCNNTRSKHQTRARVRVASPNITMGHINYMTEKLYNLRVESVLDPNLVEIFSEDW